MITVLARNTKSGNPTTQHIPGHNSLAETQKYLKFNTEIFPDVLDRFGDFTSNIFPEVEYEE